MKILPFVIASLSFAAVPFGQASDSAARITVKSEGAGDLVVVETSPSSKLIRVTPKGVSMDHPVKPDDWSTASLTFRATKDTQIKLRLAGSWKKDGHVWVLADNVKARGVEVRNPDFENGLHKTTAPDGWKFLHEDESNASIIRDPALAASGKVCVKVSDSCPVIQRFTIRKDTDVTISFAARLAQKN